MKLSCLASFTSSMVLIPVFCYIKRPKQISFTWPAVLKYLRPAAQRFLLFVFFEVRASRIHPIVHFPRNWISPSDTHQEPAHRITFPSLSLCMRVTLLLVVCCLKCSRDAYLSLSLSWANKAELLGVLESERWVHFYARIYAVSHSLITILLYCCVSVVAVAAATWGAQN